MAIWSVLCSIIISWWSARFSGLWLWAVAEPIASVAAAISNNRMEDVIKRFLINDESIERSDILTEYVRVYSAPVSHFLNFGTRAFEMMMRSGVSTLKLSAKREPNHTEISFNALRATINCRFAR